MSQFFFAWCASGTAWSDGLKRKDEAIASFTVEHGENEAAQLSLVVKNPRVGLLAAGRNVYAWLAWENDVGTTIPLFYGRLVGIPSDMLAESVTLAFLGKAVDHDAQKYAKALTLAVLPNYDPVFIDPPRRLNATTSDTTGQDADAVLEGYPRLWSVDRLTGAVDTSDILSGEDGTAVFTAAEIPRDSVKVTVGQPPLTGITVTGKVNWKQAGSGGSFNVRCDTTATNGLSIISAWPKPGASLSGGYQVYDSYAKDILKLEHAQTVTRGWRYENKAKTHLVGDIMSVSWNYTEWPPQVMGESYLISANVQSGTRPGGWSSVAQERIDARFGDDDANVPYHANFNLLLIAEVPISCSMTVGPDLHLDRAETMTVKLAADLQEIVTLPDPSDVTDIVNVNGSDVGTQLNDPSANNYFPTDRGLQSIEYLISVGVAHLKNRARAIQISWDTTFDRAIELSCRMNATINDPRLPGGTATGKIMRYSFSASGPEMLLKGNVTIGCCIGNGGSASYAAGTPQYAESTVFESGVQAFTGGTTIVTNPFALGGRLGASVGEIGYTPPTYSLQPGEPALPLAAQQLIVSQGLTEQTAKVDLSPAIDPITGDPTGEMNQVDATIKVFTLELLNLQGQFGMTYDLTTTPLYLPSQIDLSAAAQA